MLLWPAMLLLALQGSHASEPHEGNQLPTQSHDLAQALIPGHQAGGNIVLLLPDHHKSDAGSVDSQQEQGQRQAQQHTVSRQYGSEAGDLASRADQGPQALGHLSNAASVPKDALLLQHGHVLGRKDLPDRIHRSLQQQHKKDGTGQRKWGAGQERVVEVDSVQDADPYLASEHTWSLLNFELGALAVLMLALPVVYWRKMRTRHL